MLKTWPFRYGQLYKISIDLVLYVGVTVIFRSSYLLWQVHLSGLKKHIVKNSIYFSFHRITISSSDPLYQYVHLLSISDSVLLTVHYIHLMTLNHDCFIFSSVHTSPLSEILSALLSVAVHFYHITLAGISVSLYKSKEVCITYREKNVLGSKYE